ncbi:MAG: hypothetical protein ACI4JQ_09445 [Ruminococcus sp.]
MNYFVMDKNEQEIPVRLISLSPTGSYFVAKTKGYTVFRVVKTDGENVYGTAVTSGVDYSDEDGYPTHFQKVAWFEEYGFVKILFCNWDTWEQESARLYMDRALYDRKKQELHGN